MTERKQIKAEQFKINEIELTYRRKQISAPIITDQIAAANIFRQSWDINKIDLLEQFKVMLLDSRNACLGIVDIASGGIANCLIDRRLIFAAALKGRATKLILAHNHPSGSPDPSRADIELTKMLCDIGELLDIQVADHMIITRNKITSLSEKGLMP